jgi:ABC-type sugar transport system permease subunit/ABC-type glycerol-3-phosphate transport system substrate-binding protein
MSRRMMVYFSLGAVLVLLMTNWGAVSTLLARHARRPKQVVYWSPSGTPEVEKKRAREFSIKYPDVTIVPNFRETNSLRDVVFLSFLSGNPPDMLAVDLADLPERVAAGMIRPMDDLLADELKRDPGFLEKEMTGESAVLYFFADPNHFYIQNMNRYPEEAARLLNLNGKVVGFTGWGGFQTLTYNKRIFREAGRALPGAGLLDQRGEPKPPATWSELRRVARVLTEYGKRAADEARAQGKKIEQCYGLVIQGQKPRDIMRGIGPLAAAAGSRGFNFGGREWRLKRKGPDGSEKEEAVRAGFYEYENPALLAALTLFLQMKADGSVLPGAESRFYEDVRFELASGRAGMLLDGWHAALIGVERVPWSKDDIGSAAVPVPDETFERESGFRLQRGANPREEGSGTTCITSPCKSPDAAWGWLHYGSDPAVDKINTRRGTLPSTRDALARIDDPEWFPYPYQKQAVGLLLDSQAWPQPPKHNPVDVPDFAEVIHTAFFSRDGPEAALRKAREGLTRFSAACNEDLGRNIAANEVSPAQWTFPDWDPSRANVFYDRQRKYAQRPDVVAAIEQRKERLPVQYRDVSWEYKPPGNPVEVLWIPGFLAALAAGFLVWAAWRGRRPGQPGLRETLARAREHREAYVFVLPALVFITSFALYPSLYQFYLSFHSGTGIGTLRPVGWGNFERIFRDKVFWTRILGNTALYMAVVTAVQVAIGLVLASLLNLPLKANRAYRVFFFVPLVTSLAAVSIIYIGLLKGDNSGVNQMLGAVGLDKKLPALLGLTDGAQRVDWLGDPRTDLFCVMGVSIWHGLPFTIILLLAGLQSISPELYEAAKVDGASALQRFRHITIPELLPVLVVICFTSLVGAARALTAVLILTEGGKEHSSDVVALYIFKWGFTNPPDQTPDVGYASALGIIYALLLCGFALFNVWFIARQWRRRMQLRPAGGA